MILAAAFATVSCENIVEEIWSSDNEAILVLNAQLRQDAPSHRIFVNCSSGGRSEVVKDAEVTVSVNGAEPVKGVPLAYSREGFGGYVMDFFDGYEVKVALSPGDKVEVRARWNSLSASASVEVPQACGMISAVDTAMVFVPAGGEDGHDYRSRQYSITVEDSDQGKNYYMLCFEDIFYKISPAGQRLDSIAAAGRFDSSADHLLNPAETSLIEEVLGGGNRYDIFTDESFAGASHTLKVMDESWGAYNDVWMNFWDDMAEGSYYSLDRVIKVYTLTFDEYVYLRSITAANNDLGFMTEPVIYAENVTGGLGFVAVMTPSAYTIKFPAEPYEGVPPYIAYRYQNNYE